MMSDFQSENGPWERISMLAIASGTYVGLAPDNRVWFLMQSAMMTA
jgi:hypothetical protein